MWLVFFTVLFAAALTIAGTIAIFIMYRNAMYDTERKLVSMTLRGEMTGLQLIEASGHDLGMGVYSTLRRMEREGYLVSRIDYMNVESRNGRPRVYYRRAEEPLHE